MHCGIVIISNLEQVIRIIPSRAMTSWDRNTCCMLVALSGRIQQPRALSQRQQLLRNPPTLFQLCSKPRTLLLYFSLQNKQMKPPLLLLLLLLLLQMRKDFEGLLSTLIHSQADAHRRKEFQEVWTHLVTACIAALETQHSKNNSTSISAFSQSSSGSSSAAPRNSSGSNCAGRVETGIAANSSSSSSTAVDAGEQDTACLHDSSGGTGDTSGSTIAALRVQLAAVQQQLKSSILATSPADPLVREIRALVNDTWAVQEQQAQGIAGGMLVADWAVYEQHLKDAWMGLDIMEELQGELDEVRGVAETTAAAVEVLEREREVLEQQVRGLERAVVEVEPWVRMREEVANGLAGEGRKWLGQWSKQQMAIADCMKAAEAPRAAGGECGERDWAEDFIEYFNDYCENSYVGRKWAAYRDRCLQCQSQERKLKRLQSSGSSSTCGGGGDGSSRSRGTSCTGLGAVVSGASAVGAFHRSHSRSSSGAGVRGIMSSGGGRGGGLRPSPLSPRGVQSSSSSSHGRVWRHTSSSGSRVGGAGGQQLLDVRSSRGSVSGAFAAGSLLSPRMLLNSISSRSYSSGVQGTPVGGLGFKSRVSELLNPSKGYIGSSSRPVSRCSSLGVGGGRGAGAAAAEGGLEVAGDAADVANAAGVSVGISAIGGKTTQSGCLSRCSSSSREEAGIVCNAAASITPATPATAVAVGEPVGGSIDSRGCCTGTRNQKLGSYITNSMAGATLKAAAVAGGEEAATGPLTGQEGTAAAAGGGGGGVVDWKGSISSCCPHSSGAEGRDTSSSTGNQHTSKRSSSSRAAGGVDGGGGCDGDLGRSSGELCCSYHSSDDGGGVVRCNVSLGGASQSISKMMAREDVVGINAAAPAAVLAVSHDAS